MERKGRASLPPALAKRDPRHGQGKEAQIAERLGVVFVELASLAICQGGKNAEILQSMKGI